MHRNSPIDAGRAWCECVRARFRCRHDHVIARSCSCSGRQRTKTAHAVLRRHASTRSSRAPLPVPAAEHSCQRAACSRAATRLGHGLPRLASAEHDLHAVRYLEQWAHPAVCPPHLQVQLRAVERSLVRNRQAQPVVRRRRGREDDAERQRARPIAATVHDRGNAGSGEDRRAGDEESGVRRGALRDDIDRRAEYGTLAEPERGVLGAAAVAEGACRRAERGEEQAAVRVRQIIEAGGRGAGADDLDEDGAGRSAEIPVLTSSVEGQVWARTPAQASRREMGRDGIRIMLDSSASFTVAASRNRTGIPRISAVAWWCATAPRGLPRVLPSGRRARRPRPGSLLVRP
jgi:hypothetical protein